MPARPKTAKKAAAAVKPRTGTFARLQAKAKEGTPEVPPYVIDDVNPPIVIELPDTIEQQVGLADLFTMEGDFRIGDARRILELICGDAFPRVWELMRREHITVLVAFIHELGEHFGGFFDPGARDFPGGSGASSS